MRRSAFAAALILAAATGPGGLAAEMSGIECLPIAEQQRIANDFTALMKARGLDDSGRTANQIAALAAEASAKMSAAAACYLRNNEDEDMAGGKCQAERRAAKDAENTLEGWSQRMEAMATEMEKIRARYRPCP